MNKKYLVFGILGLFAVMLVSAAVVTYWGQAQVDMEVTEAITTVGGVCSFSTTAGGNYELCLLEVTNNLEREIAVDFTLRVQKDTNGFGNYENLVDDEGVLIGLTEDVGYYFDDEHGGCTGPNTNGCGPAFEEQTMEQWMLQFPDWLDWYVTQPYEGEYDTSIINGVGRTDLASLTGGELTFPEDISASDIVNIVIYVDSTSGLEKGDYKVVLEVSPSTA